MPATDNAARARRWFDDIWNQRRDETAHELLDREAVGHLEGLTTRGIDEFFVARSYIITAFPDFRIQVEDTVADGEDVVVRWSGTGTHRGMLMDVPPTGTTVNVRGLTWLRFAHGRIVEGWDAWNQGGMMADLRAASGRATPRG